MEHYRPKARVSTEQGDKPGYYWLAARWENLLPSCTDCNSPRKQVMAGVTVRQDDYVIADRCGTVFVPQERIADVLALGERIARRQQGMVAAVRAGRPVADVMHDKEFEAIKAN